MSLLDKFLPDAEAMLLPSSPQRTILEALGGASRNVESFAGSGKEVGQSRDLARVIELPRRERPQSFEDFGHLKKTGPCLCASKYKRRCPSALMPTQAWALAELRDRGGLLGAIPVGEGKTLLDLLAAMVVPDCKAAVLLIPPQLRNQMHEVDWAFYGQHWQLPNLGSGLWFDASKPTLHIIAYSELSSAKNSNVLDRIRPDLIIADEAHLLRNSTTARVKRFKRYFSANPATRFACWSGTLTTKSIKDYAHLSALALREGSPTPLHWPTVEEWAGAVDPSDWPTGIGALRALCAPGEHIREGYRRRLADTSGVITASDRSSCPASLTFMERKTEAPKEVHEAIHSLNMTWTRPDGEELITGLDVARCGRELSSGFYYRWTWPRGETKEVRAHWMSVRKDWHKEMREKLKQSKEFMDSPLLLVRAALRWQDGFTHIKRDPHGKEIERQQIPPCTKNAPEPTWKSEMWPTWRTVRDTAKPETEGVWISDWLARDAADWCRSGVGICWYEHDLFGKRVADLSGAPLFGPGDVAASALIRESAERSVVASIRAHGTGKNLQAFCRNLIGNQFADAAVGEQLIGRTHRQGQLADEVTIEVYRHTAVVIDALNRAKMLASYIEQTMGNRQKLLQATYTF